MGDLDNTLKIEQLLEKIRSDIPFEERKSINKKRLVNILNYINFKNGSIIINFKHHKYGNIISLNARPQPCTGDILDCVWINATEIVQKLKPYEFQNIMVSDGLKIILAKPELARLNEDGISFNLPDTCHEFNPRMVKRHPCEGIQAELIQNGIVFNGELLDFSAVSFNVKISIAPPQTFHWINPDKAVYIILKNKQDVLFSGECKITMQTSGQNTKTFVLEPLNSNIARFKQKKFRSARQKLIPSPSISFRHPVIKKFITLPVEDISGSGLSVEEYYERSVLLPGMIIQELEIEFGSGFKINCKAQVVYRGIHKTSDEETVVKCGIAFLDMDIQDQARLSSILHSAANKKSYVCNRVDLDDLWNFFFETGFVYPKKYAQIYADKEKFIETYKKLYNHNPHIARHFVYLDKGIIKGHMSMLRFYENTWLIHHHASSSSGFNKAGIIVLNQVGKYINDFHSLQSTNMNFVACYFRPENKFPNRVFGGLVNDLNNYKGASIDTFAYFYFPKNFTSWDLPPLMLTQTQKNHLLELEGFYEHESGGLMLSALDLGPDVIEHDNLSNEYKKAGFKKERHLFSLKKEGALKAIFMVNVSDAGLNLSNLTNCIHAIVIDADDLPKHALISALSMLSKYFEQPEIPILLYPVSYAEKESIPYEKRYNLWILNMQNTDDYFSYIDKLLKRFD